MLVSSSMDIHGVQNHDTLLIRHLIIDGHKYEVPFNLIGLLFSQQHVVEKNLD
jgi:hypothetical protein